MQADTQLPTTPPLSGPDLVSITNGALQTIATDFAGANDPAVIAWPYSTWADTGNNLLKRRNAADTEWVIEGQLFVPGILVLPTAPTSKLSDVIRVLDRRQFLTWQTIGTFTGYASAEVGDFRWGTSIVAKPGTEFLIGQTIDRTLPKYAALIAWAEVNGHMVSSGSWVKGAFHFSTLTGNNVRLPDLRDQFIRATGTDADTANARGLGSVQIDSFKSHTHTITSGINVFRASGPDTIVGLDGAQQTGATGSAETRPINTAFHPAVCL